MIIAPTEFGLPDRFSEWRPGQYEAVDWVLAARERFVALCAPTGYGKSLAYMAMAAMSGLRTVVLTSTKGLQDQLNSDFASISTDIRGMQNYPCDMAVQFGFPATTRVADAPCMAGAKCPMRGGGCGYFDQLRRAQRADIVVTNYQCWMHSTTLHTDENPVEMLVCDECFSAGTMVGNKPIEDYRRGDTVLSFNQNTNAFQKSYVGNIYKRHAPDKMCRLYFSDGTSINCTLNHPLWTQQGWVPAYRLLLGNVLCLKHATNLPGPDQYRMRELQETCNHNVTGRQVQLPPPWAGCLLNGVRFTPWFAQEYERRKSADALQTDDRTESYEECQDKSQNEYHTSGYGMETDSAGRERPRSFHGTEIISFDAGMGDGSGDIPWTEEAFFSDVLQGRYSSFCFASCNRSGREQPLLATEIGCQEGSHAEWIRVDGFEIYQRSDREGFASVCPDGYVYNIEVEGTHTYTAEGVVAHNCHDTVDELSSFLATSLERKECLSLGVTWPLSGYSQGEWVDWAKYWQSVLAERRETLEGRLRTDGGGSGVGPGMSILHEIRESKKLERKLERVAKMQDQWVIEEVDRVGDSMKSCKFDPLWPRHYREQLFRRIPKVVLVSATVRPKTLELLGIAEDEMAFQEYESSFPVAHRPVIHVPTVRMNYHSEKDDGTMMWWLRKIDLLVGTRADRKGVIHTVSYKRARFLLDNSQHAARMMIHGSDNRAHVIERFRRSGPGAVLLSPSVDTGYDFAGELAEYQIIVKLPFPDTRGAVMKARCHEDKDYSAYLTAQVLQQMTGRVCRSETDLGETLIVDDNIGWYAYKYRHYLNSWWLESYRVQKGKLPEPLRKL